MLRCLVRDRVRVRVRRQEAGLVLRYGGLCSHAVDMQPWTAAAAPHLPAVHVLVAQGATDCTPLPKPQP